MKSKHKLNLLASALAALVVLPVCDSTAKEEAGTPPAADSALSAKERDRAIGRKDGRTPEEVIAAVDSSGWAVNPLDHGMSAMDYERAEAELLFGNFAKRAGGVNKFFHFQGLTKADDRWVVSVNNDTIYSVATVDARKGFSVAVPDVGGRFMSIHIQDFNHTIVDYTWNSGTHHYAADEIDTDYVLVGIRTATDGSEADQAYVIEKLQPNYKIEAASALPFEPRFDPELTEKVRAALMPEYAKLPNTYGTVKYDIRAVDNWEKWTYTIAGGLGLSPEDTAMYVGFVPEGTKGGVCYEASFDPIPANAFFSITLYNKDKYLMADEFNIISSNRKNFIRREDGGFDVIFGGMGCKALAEERGVNFAYTPEDGWNGLVRAYRPDVEKMRGYRMPQLERIDSPASAAEGAKSESHLVQVGSAAVEYFSDGKGETVVLFPGGGLNVNYMEGLAQSLSEAGYRAVRINPRGAGASKSSADDVTLHDLAGDVAKVIESLGVGPVHVAGHAFGNRVARMLAADHPELVRSVILLAAGGKVAATPEADAALKVVFSPTATEKEYLAAMNYMVGDPKDAKMAGEALTRSRAPGAGAIQYKTATTVPVDEWWAPAGKVRYLALQGSNDQAAPPENGVMLQKDLGDRVTLVTMKGAGHLMLVTRPQETAKAIMTFLKSLPEERN